MEELGFAEAVDFELERTPPLLEVAETGWVVRVCSSSVQEEVDFPELDLADILGVLRLVRIPAFVEVTETG